MDQNISLYLDLEEGRNADLETTARAMIAFSKAIKEASYFLSPEDEVSVSLLSSTEGSLCINSIIRRVRDSAQNREVRIALLASLFMFIVQETGSFLYSNVLEMALNEEEETITSEQAEEIKRLLSELAKNKKMKDHADAVVKEVSRDKSVKGLGVTSTPNRRPIFILPRDEFERRSQFELIVESLVKKRTREHRFVVILIRPFLRMEASRRWRFDSPIGPFSAPIRDEEFLAQILSGTYSTPLAEGIRMDVLLETKEELEAGVWAIKEWNILKVYDAWHGPQGDTLPLD